MAAIERQKKKQKKTDHGRIPHENHEVTAIFAIFAYFALLM